MQKFLSTYPFLSEIRLDVLSAIDLEVLYEPSLSERELLNKLSRDLDKHILVYQKNHVCKGAHVCRTLRSASLNSKQLETLKLTEGFFTEGQVIVAYEKPLIFL